ncbi:MAG: cysteine--tRNA ligase [Deltaproteobacteria bacterium]|nr:cysteine--tRNA ligase [Deltaproteobacteria bacterium]
MRIYNTLTREKSEFTPITPGRVSMYVCGITSYAPSHIGHARAYVSFDTVYRWLSRRYEVTFVRNFTDVDDKIINAAKALGEDPKELSERYIAMFHEDMGRLGCRSPSHEPKVTEHIGPIVALIEEILAKGHAYGIDGDVYFDVASFPAYGKLSGRSIEDLLAGARVEVDQRKRSPNDFALWKSAKPGEPAWDSPWGKGRPGWHIECSAMSKTYLGTTFDLHCGGKDLVFPHHENEIAQTCAASGNSVMANVWMHNGFVNLLPEACPSCKAELPTEGALTACPSCGRPFSEEELKMSKSRNNFFPIREVLERHEPEALRLFLLSSHYRSPIAFSEARLDEAGRRVEKAYETLDRIGLYVASNGQTIVETSGPRFEEVFGTDPRKAFQDAMDDDFNTALALAETTELLKTANDLLHGTERTERKLGDRDRARLLAEILELVWDQGDILGIFRETPSELLARTKTRRSSALVITPSEIEALIAARAEARRNKDFLRADELRKELDAKGIIIKDGKGGTTWEPKV